MKKTTKFALLGAVLGLISTSAAFAEVDCLKLSLAVKHAVAADKSATLQIVEAQVAENPNCACEVVKAAIEGSGADAKLVASIVEVAVTAAPDQMRLVSQCAVAVAPDALSDVQMVLAKLDPNKGESGYSAKGAKGVVAAPEVASMGNPLDFPGQGPVGPPPGGPGGYPTLPPGPPLNFPPIIVDPPPVSETDPQDT